MDVTISRRNISHKLTFTAKRTVNMPEAPIPGMKLLGSCWGFEVRHVAFDTTSQEYLVDFVDNIINQEHISKSYPQVYSKYLIPENVVIARLVSWYRENGWTLDYEAIEWMKKFEQGALPGEHEEKTLQEVALIVQAEGLGYAVQSHMSANSIQDQDLRTKWRQAAKLLDEIDNILEPYCED